MSPDRPTRRRSRWRNTLNRLRPIPLDDLALTAILALTGAWYIAIEHALMIGIFTIWVGAEHLVSAVRKVRLIAVTAERDRLRKQATEPRCDSTIRGVLNNNLGIWVCHHPVGHQGRHGSDDGTQWTDLLAPEQRITNALRVAETWERHVKAVLGPDEAAHWTTISGEVVDVLNGLETRLPDGTTIPATTQEQR